MNTKRSKGRQSTCTSGYPLLKLLVLQGLVSTQVISAFGTPGSREYSSYFEVSAFGTPGTRGYSSHETFFVLQVLASIQPTSAFGTPGTRE